MIQYPDIESNYINNSEKNTEFKNVLKYREQNTIKCDNCNQTSFPINIFHQIKFSNLPETFYFCKRCYAGVLSASNELNDKLHECLLWITKNRYIFPLGCEKK